MDIHYFAIDIHTWFNVANVYQVAIYLRFIAADSCQSEIGLDAPRH